jgi:YHS domain-containing protein
MKNILCALSLATILMLQSCGGSKPKETSSTGNEASASTTKFIDKKILGYDKDPVCLMPINDEMEDSTLHNGIVYGFCCEGCKNEFVAEPSKFLAKGK